MFRMAARTPLGDYVEENIKFIEDVANYYSKIEELVSSNELNLRPELFYNDITNKIFYMMRRIAYYFGDLHGVLINRNEILNFINDIYTINKGNLICNIMEQMFIELDNLFQNYLNWDANEFNGLNKIILKVYNDFDIVLKFDENGLVNSAYTNFGITQ